MANAPLTIALILATPGTTWGGMEKHTADLARELANLGHQTHVFAHKGYQSQFAARVHFHPCPFQLGRRNPWLKYRLGRRLQALHPDIIHAQGNKAAALLAGMKPRGGITLGTIHGTKSSHRDFSKLGGVIAVSNGIYQTLRHPNAKLIYNGTGPRNSDSKATHSIPASQAFALAIGRLEPVKQFSNLIAAWATIKPALPLYILGDGTQASLLKAQVQRLGAESFIRLPGYEKNPAAWLQHASVCIISSEREGFPYALVEALLAGCPVLSTPVNGAVDLLPPHSLAKATDQDSLQALLSEHLGNLESLKKSQERCFEQAARALTLEAMARSTADFYYQLLNRR